jgi:hypothetical protein
MIDFTGKNQDWWPDMKGRTVAILASGPSMARAQCDLVRGTDWTAVAINETWRLAPWAAVLYGCDWQWWAAKAPQPNDFDGLRVVGTVAQIRGKSQLTPKMAWQEPFLHYLPVKAGAHTPLWTGTAVGAGSNSAFQVANWVARCGVKRIILLGVDCHSPNAHWHGGHDHPKAQHQKPQLMNTWLRAWKNAAPEFVERGIEVINCSPASALKEFRRANLVDVVTRQAA